MYCALWNSSWIYCSDKYRSLKKIRCEKIFVGHHVRRKLNTWKFYYHKEIEYRMWENFGGGKLWRINGSKVFGEEKIGESVGSLLKILAFINIGGENFGELSTVCQICQNFPPPKISHVR